MVGFVCLVVFLFGWLVGFGCFVCLTSDFCFFVVCLCGLVVSLFHLLCFVLVCFLLVLLLFVVWRFLFGCAWACFVFLCFLRGGCWFFVFSLLYSVLFFFCVGGFRFVGC